MKNYNKKGFTLIELLVVISIISLLSSVVLASLRTARLKAQDTAIIQSVRQMANLMALEANENAANSYSNLNRGWITYANNCVPTSVWLGNYVSQMTELCLRVRANQPSSYTNTFYISSPYVGGSNRFTIMAQLPYRTQVNNNSARYVCIGSNGAFSTDGRVVTNGTSPWVGPVSGGWWAGNGCYGDPNF